MMTRISLGLLALGLLAPVALSQEPATFADAELDATPPPANGWADITSGEMALADEATIRLTMGFTALPDVTPGMAYLFVFSDGERERFAGVITAPTVQWIRGTWDGDDAGPGSNEETQGDYTQGPGGLIRVDFPVSALPSNVTTILAPRILAGDIKSGASPVQAPLPFIVYHDKAAGEASLRIRAASATAPETAPGDEADPDSTPATSAPAATADRAGAPSTPTRETPAPVGAVALFVAALLFARRARGSG